jgi:hypothetical protein
VAFKQVDHGGVEGGQSLGGCSTGPQWWVATQKLLLQNAFVLVEQRDCDRGQVGVSTVQGAPADAGACISLRHVILDVAAGTGTIDVDRLTEAIDTGAFRAAVMDQFRAAQGGRVTCSPHLFLHDGSNMANPGVRVRWQNGGFGIGFPVIDADDPGVYVDLLTRAAAATARTVRNDTSPHQLAAKIPRP